MNKYLITLLIILPPLCYSVTDSTENATRNAVSTTRRALMAVPEVRRIVQEAGEDAMNFVGLTKEQAASVAPVAVLIQGRITTKYFKGIRYREKNWSLTPLVEYHIRREDLRLELGFYYGF